MCKYPSLFCINTLSIYQSWLYDTIIFVNSNIFINVISFFILRLIFKWYTYKRTTFNNICQYYRVVADINQSLAKTIEHDILSKVLYIRQIKYNKRPL